VHSPVEYKYVLLLCAVAALFALLPPIVSKVFKWQMPYFLRIFLYVYIICGIILGNVYDFYYRIRLWDKLLHFFSGILLMVSSIILINIFTEKGYIRLNRAFTVVVALLFTMAIGSIWEFIEYGIDCWLDVNMQRYMLPDGTLLRGQDAVHDSMLDMIAAFAGALITSIYLAIRGSFRSKAAGKLSAADMTDNPTA
jgi:hypothetical protein